MARVVEFERCRANRNFSPCFVSLAYRPGKSADVRCVNQADLSCRHTRQSVGTIYTRTNFVTLKYVTDSWGADTNGFHLVVTAFKDKSNSLSSNTKTRGTVAYCVKKPLIGRRGLLRARRAVLDGVRSLTDFVFFFSLFEQPSSRAAISAALKRTFASPWTCCATA